MHDCMHAIRNSRDRIDGIYMSSTCKQGFPRGLTLFTPGFGDATSAALCSNLSPPMLSQPQKRWTPGQIQQHTFLSFETNSLSSCHWQLETFKLTFKLKDKGKRPTPAKRPRA
eukprot:1136849-Pelagomonas_calceolata.AAC.1